MDKEETSKTVHFRGVQSMGKTAGPAQYHTTELEGKLKKQWVRLLTTFLYFFTVSISAVVLAIYYGVYWSPNISSLPVHKHTSSLPENGSTTSGARPTSSPPVNESTRRRLKWLRCATVLVYILSVCLSAVLLAVYYGIFWYPEPKLIITNPTDFTFTPTTGGNIRTVPRGKKG